MTDEQALAFVYQVFRDVLNSFPTYLGDYIHYAGLPDGYEEPHELLEQADKAAAKLRANK